MTGDCGVSGAAAVAERFLCGGFGTCLGVLCEVGICFRSEAASEAQRKPALAADEMDAERCMQGIN